MTLLLGEQKFSLGGAGDNFFQHDRALAKRQKPWS